MSNLCNKKSLIIYGSGAMAAVYASYARYQFKVKAFTVERRFCHGNCCFDLDLIPFEAIEQQLSPQDYAMIIAVGYVEMNQVRARISREAKQKGYQLEQFVAPDLWQHEGVQFGENTMILDKSSVHCNTHIGNNVFIASGVNIGHDCKIEDNTWINSGVTLAGGVHIGAGSFIGINAAIAQDVILAPGTFVGANSLVTKNTDLNEVIVSEPGQIFPVHSRDYLALLEKSNAC